MRISVATISSGRAISSSPPAAWRRVAPSPRPGACWAGSRRRRRPTATGRRIAGSTARPIGPACRWTSARFRSCWSICSGARGRWASTSCAAIGRWCAAPLRTLCRTGRSPGRTAGRRMAASRPSRSPSRSRPCSPPPIFAEHLDDADGAVYLRETADLWNDHIERWIYATGTPLARRARRRWLLCADRARRRGRRHFARSTASCRSRIARPTMAWSAPPRW